MGAGKTTVGRQLARRLNWQFIDTDLEIEARTGVKIPVIFEIEGEAGFRRRESQLIAELAGRSAYVLATGGGAVLDASNRANMARGGVVVYLAVAPEILWERVKADKGRPLLQVADPRLRVFELHAVRDPIYREVADLTILGGKAPPSAVVRQIESALRDRCDG